jgi:starch phosphorylase
MDCVEADRELADVIDLIASGFFSRGDPEVFRPFLYGLLNYDPYFVLADFRSYVDCQDSVGRAFQDAEHWARMSILNVAHSGFFSSDRTILEYCKDIWRVKPVQIRLMSPGESKPVGTATR